MSLIKCVECRNEIDSSDHNCPVCGCPVEHSHIREYDTMAINSSIKHKSKVKRLRNSLIVLSLVCIVFSGVFFSNAADVKNNYYNSESYPRLNENAYVGGDAYNYIINGTYFTGYSVLGTALIVCSAIFIHGAVNASLTIYESEDRENGFN